MGCAGGNGERGRIRDDLRSLLLQPDRTFRESDVVADLHSDLSNRRLDGLCDAFAWRNDFRLLKRELRRHNIEQMQLPVESSDFAAKIENSGS